MSTIPTPRTDAEAERILKEFGPNNNQRFAAACDHARQLETALAQSEAGAAKLREALELISGYPEVRYFVGTIIHDKTKAALSTTAGTETLAELRDLRDRLAKAEGERDVSHAANKKLKFGWQRLGDQFKGGNGPRECFRFQDACRKNNGEVVGTILDCIFSLWSDLYKAEAELSTARESSEKLAGAVEEYLEAQDAFDNREYEANPGDHFALDKRRNAYRADLDAALAAHRKGEK